jgi:chromosome segregation ATPase
MTMDLTQISQMVKWLDEERRKDKAAIAALQERLETQEEQFSRIDEQLASLKETLASYKVLPGRIAKFTDSLERLQLELTNMISSRDEQHRKEHREMERSRQLEIGALRDEISRVAGEIRPIPRLEERIGVVAAENSRINETVQRLNGVVTDQGKRFEDRLQAVVYLEEQRRADHQRIVEMEKIWPEIHKRVETVAAKLPLLEDALPKLKSRLEEGLKPIKEFETVVEELRVADFRRNQEVKKWAGQAAEVREEIARVREERQGFLEDYRDVQDALKQVEEFTGRLEIRQNEALERQRLTEERIKRQWEEWQTKQEKSRRNWEVGEEERWREQTRFNDRVQKEIAEFPPVLKFFERQVNAIWSIRRDEASRLLKIAQNEYEAMVTEVDEQMADFREQFEAPKGV